MQPLFNARHRKQTTGKCMLTKQANLDYSDLEQHIQTIPNVTTKTSGADVTIMIMVNDYY